MRLPEDLWEKVRKLADEQDRSKTHIVVDALWHYFALAPEPLPHKLAKEMWESPALNEQAYAPRSQPLAEEPSIAAPSAVWLSGKTGMPRAACQRHIDNGTWREIL